MKKAIGVLLIAFSGFLLISSLVGICFTVKFDPSDASYFAGQIIGVLILVAIMFFSLRWGLRLIK